MASELRYRGAGSSSSTVVETPAAAKMTEEEHKEKVVEELMAMVQRLKQGPKPGLSNEAKKAKDALAVDPYDMLSIMRLGLAYADDEQWQQCANVMLRGFKRVKELHEPVLRIQYLTTLCQASIALKKYKQAMAVMSDVEEPIPPECDENNFCVLKCQVYCWNEQEQKGLKAFHDAIEGQDFQHKCAMWAQCWPALRKVGLVELTKSKVATYADTEEDKAKLDAIEKLAEMKATIVEEASSSSSAPTTYKLVVASFSAIFLLVILYGLYVLEQKSLQNLNMIK